MSKPRRTCQTCKAPIPVFAQQHADPYCSTECCRKDLGLELPTLRREPPSGKTLEPCERCGSFRVRRRGWPECSSVACRTELRNERRRRAAEQLKPVSVAEKRALLEANGEEWPTCVCHGVPMSWHATRQVAAGGNFKCRVKVNARKKSWDRRVRAPLRQQRKAETAASSQTRSAAVSDRKKVAA